MGRLHRSLWVALASVSVAAAQDADPVRHPDRERAFGIARTVSGEPWAGATVILFARPIPGDETVGVADRVEATTDPSGRFHAAILPGLVYSAWAWGDEDDGSYRSSQVAEGVVPRQPVLLTRSERARPRGPIRLVVAEGVAAPVEVWVRVQTRNVLLIEAGVGADGSFEMPRLPAGIPSTIEVLDADGVRLVSSVVRPDRDPPAGVAVPARVPIPVLIRDVFSEAAPAQPYVALAQGNRLLRLGDLAADGCGTVAVPEWARHELVAYASRRAGATLQRSVEPAKEDGTPWPVLREGFEHQGHAHVGPGATLRGRIVLGPGRPVARGWIAFEGVAMHYMSPNRRALCSVRRSLELGVDGRFEIDHLLDEYPPSLLLVLAPEHIAALPDAWRTGLSPVVPAIVDLRDVGGPKNNVVRDAGEIDLLDLVPVHVSIRASDGVPAIGATFRLSELRRGQIGVSGPAFEWTADRTGGLALLLPRRDYFCEVATASGDLDFFTIRCDPGGRLAKPVPIRLALREPAVIRGQLVDRDGRPLSGYALQFGLPGPRRAMPRDDAAQTDSPPAAPVRVEAGFYPANGARIAQQIARAASGLRTDADGRFAVRVPPIPLDYSLRIGHTVVDVTVDGEGDPEPLRIVLGR